MGHPLNAIERALVERHIRDHGVTRCPPCRRGTLPHLCPETAVDRMRRLWRSMIEDWQAEKQRQAPRGPTEDVLRWHRMYQNRPVVRGDRPPGRAGRLCNLGGFQAARSADAAEARGAWLAKGVMAVALALRLCDYPLLNQCARQSARVTARPIQRRYVAVMLGSRWSRLRSRPGRMAAGATGWAVVEERRLPLTHGQARRAIASLEKGC
jgi:hypothetical protein